MSLISARRLSVTFPILALLLLAASPVHAITLSDLNSNGGALTIGNFTFSNFTYLSRQGTNQIDPTQFSITPSQPDANSVSLLFERSLPAGTFGSSFEPISGQFAYSVTTTTGTVQSAQLMLPSSFVLGGRVDLGLSFITPEVPDLLHAFKSVSLGGTVLEEKDLDFLPFAKFTPSFTAVNSFNTSPFSTTGFTDASISGIVNTFSTVGVPEPASLTLLPLAVAALALRFRRS